MDIEWIEKSDYYELQDLYQSYIEEKDRIIGINNAITERASR